MSRKRCQIEVCGGDGRDSFDKGFRGGFVSKHFLQDSITDDDQVIFPNSLIIISVTQTFQAFI